MPTRPGTSGSKGARARAAVSKRVRLTRRIVDAVDGARNLLDWGGLRWENGVDVPRADEPSPAAPRGRRSVPGRGRLVHRLRAGLRLRERSFRDGGARAR